MLSNSRAWLKKVGLSLLPTLFFLATLGFIYRRLIAGWVLVSGDLHTYFFPYWAAAARAFQAGIWPLWNPDLFAGAPFLANSQAAIFYPLNWPLWLISGPSLAGMARSLHWSVVLHLCLAAGNTYILARKLGLGPWASMLSGFFYAANGYLGVHIEHLNQLQALAWLPLVLLPLRDVSLWKIQGSKGSPAPVSVLAWGLILLAGHTQMAFIALIALLVWRLALLIPAVWQVLRETGISVTRLSLWHRLPGYLRACGDFVWSWGVTLLPFSLSVGLAAVQLLPTIELAGFSMRSGGLPWREAVSFSLSPWQVHQALLPPYLVPPLLPEGCAYLGLTALALAFLAVVWGWVKRDARLVVPLALFALTGLFLAFGGYNPFYLLAVRLGTPGLVHFRAPARFLILYVLGMSLLAGCGGAFIFGYLRSLPARSFLRFAVPFFLIGLAVFELGYAAEFLPHARATAPRAYTDLRPATAHLIAASAESRTRFLSISKTLFDVGDKAEMQAIYANTFSPEAFWAYEVAAKQREVLVPNLSLAFDVPAADGYDGGLLPLRHYAAFSELLLPGGTLDGRLRENLEVIPEGRWLSLLGVRFLITDKTLDAWSDNVFYDRQFEAQLALGETLTLAWVPADFVANALGVLSQGTGVVELHFDGERIIELPLPTSEAQPDMQRVRWDSSGVVRKVVFRATGSMLKLNGVSLIDERTQAFYSLVLSDRFRLVHSGDVKIYENQLMLPAAFLVHQYTCVASDELALELLRAPSFDPAQQVVLAECDALALPALSHADAAAQRVEEQVTLLAYEDNRLEFEIKVADAGILVMTDAWYPGWRAKLEPLGETGAEVLYPDTMRADVLFRALPVTQGSWRLTLTYQSRWFHVGLSLSVLGLFAIVVYAVALGERTQGEVV